MAVRTAATDHGNTGPQEGTRCLKRNVDQGQPDRAKHVDHAILDSLTDDDIDRMAETDAERHGYELSTYDELVTNGGTVDPDVRDAPALPTAAKDATPEC
jgi:hypothetical protein